MIDIDMICMISLLSCAFCSVAVALKELPSEEKKACLLSLMETLAGKRGFTECGARIRTIFLWGEVIFRFVRCINVKNQQEACSARHRNMLNVTK